jgi:hypothetical protein
MEALSTVKVMVGAAGGGAGGAGGGGGGGGGAATFFEHPNDTSVKTSKRRSGKRFHKQTVISEPP